MTKTLKVKLGLFALALALLVAGFKTLIFDQMPGLFQDPKEDLSFGWYVPLFSIYVVVVERKKILASLAASSWWGAFLTLPFLFLGFLGVRGLQVRFEIVAFVGLLITLTWAFFGRAAARRVLFPAAFLLFCTPLATFLDVITVHLRLFATGTACAILKGVGSDIVRTGTMLAAPDGSFAIDVADPCSGLRSIFALMALTAGYAYFTQKTLLTRLLLFACSVPLAVIGNIVRILTICLVGTCASKEFAIGFYHDYSGYVVFLAALALMVVVGEGVSRLGRLLPSAKTAAPEETAPSAAPASERAPLLLPCATLAVLAVAMATLLTTPETTLCEAPRSVLTELAGFTSEPLAASEAETTILPKDTRIDKRLYTAPDGTWFAVSLVMGGHSKSSIHRPELCLPSQGFLMRDPKTVTVGDTPWRTLILVSATAPRPLQFAYTFYNQDGFRTSSHVRRIMRDIWDRSFFNRIDRWAMVTVCSSAATEEELKAFLLDLERMVR